MTWTPSYRPRQSVRHFSRFIAHVVCTFRMAGLEYTSEFQSEFVCAFCKRSLEACVRLGKYLPFPSRYFHYTIEFQDLGFVDINDNSLKYTNYDSISAQLVRALIWDLSISNLIGYDLYTNKDSKLR